MNAPTLPPASADKAAEAFALRLAALEAARRPNDSGLLRALAEAWAHNQKPVQS